MAPTQKSRSLRLICVSAAAVGSWHLLQAFVGGPAGGVPRSDLSIRYGFESGKVNLGLEEWGDKAPMPPQPVLDCDETCMTAIMDCLDEGCSVEALLKLDTKLATDEQKIADTVEKISAANKMEPSAENSGTMAWLQNF
eukprot:CAMPEP_0197656110 /NCGR_PEP_ID=MMETSP1338-20131121/40305_1 /TAXON_ID=43686 ORGANISM="Pelagodinium beii, Strain RCC1491" /NCGR_SAMPLE_ID=MMETSP1338 /ASSEMBLY_ACC=CAM_ASM_000754 /LENGTH=138 /DNA_ID=CAMNT_0043231945 /DNA_START=79 /DNA_END=492 /DNA_ORIENTATION=+